LPFVVPKTYLLKIKLAPNKHTAEKRLRVHIVTGDMAEHMFERQGVYQIGCLKLDKLLSL
jgi:hypothetical protein